MMRSSLAEMTPDCFGSSGDLTRNGSEMTVIERQQTQMKFLQQQHQSSAGETQYNDQARIIQASQQTQSLTKGDLGPLNPCLGWPELVHLSMPKEMLHSSSDNVHDRYSLEMSTLTIAFSTGVPYRTATLENDGGDIVVAPKSSLEIVKDSLKKRKADQWPNPKSIHMKGGTSINKQVVPDASKENSKTSEVTKPEYIHVRARRGQATDSHSLAERVRREKIGQRMRILQDVVPGCNKITGKAGMLDEIINYVQVLQRQVEFLSMKLATVTIAHDFNNIINIPSAVHTGVAVTDAISHAHLFFNQSYASNITETGQNSFDTARGSTMSTPTSVHKYFLDAAGFTPPLTWNPDFQAVPGQTFHQSRSGTFSSHPPEADTTSMSNQFTMF